MIFSSLRANRITHILLMVFVLATISVSAQSAASAEPVTIYLTWQRDPTTTMTVQWITKPNQKSEDVYYQKEGDETWEIAVGAHQPMPEKDPYLVHRAELTHLSPGAVYHFKIGEWKASTHKFRTMPKTLDHPIRFVVGGDVYGDGIEHVIETNKQAAKVEPMFALVGGDIAYAGSKRANGKGKRNRRWLSWLIAWKKHMVTPRGFLIPLIPAIGNHDVNGRYDQTPKQAQFFYSLFAFPGIQGYRALDVGDYLSLIILDSGHTHPIPGNQTHWLHHTLQKRAEVPHKFALYHVPAFPSVRKFNGKRNILIRKNWVPKFEQFGLTAAFENHEHVYKRSQLIYQGRAATHGVLYMGDGAWGVKKPRKPKNVNKEWYLAKAASARHFIMVTLDNKERKYQAIDHQGREVDRYVQTREEKQRVRVNL